MREQLDTAFALGFYRPSFFKMQVNHTYDLTDLNSLSDIVSAIYLHEYIHFLQDITTTNGFANISTVVDYIKYVNEAVIKGASRTFIVPVMVSHSSTSLSLDLKKEYVGSTNDVVTAKISYISKQAKTDANSDLYVIKIDYLDSCKNLCTHYFGSHCIIESMAYLVENSIYSNIINNTNDFPYKAAQKVIEHEYPIFLNDPLNVLALCDASLGVFNPGEFFYNMLTKMKKERFLPGKPEDVYEYCASNIRFNYDGAINLNQLLNLTSKIARKQLCDYFTTSVFGDNKIWIEKTIETAVDIRLSNPYFVLEIARGGRIQKNISFLSIFNKVGTPMVSNLSDEGTFFSPLQNTFHNIRPEYLWVISQVYGLYIKTLTKNTKKCELKTWCQKSCDSLNIADYTDENCYNSPWLRVKNPQLCSFATIWKTWGLENETPS